MGDVLAGGRDFLHCRVCGCLSRKPDALGQYDVVYCPRCGAKIKTGFNNSIEVTWALLIAAAILYIPANLMPVMSVYMLGSGQPDTIISGALHLVEAGQWPLALLIFVASIVVPLLKLFSLGFLLLTIQKRSVWRQRDRVLLYRATEYVGRWSMVDVFVIAILAGLVQFGNLVRVETNIGTLSFAGVVVLTMIAAHTLDEHLIWDVGGTKE
uniref:Paraquat-inducible protein A n=1 Tax=uncultured Thiotrichaceae bacterium TaxID=298394 RepID=A0A6S6T2A5_9GAMM|nr:MAG: Paraquat-inducible protein A [uncultured Thiotrichaceae bacterium]